MGLSAVGCRAAILLVVCLSRDCSAGLDTGGRGGYECEAPSGIRCVVDALSHRNFGPIVGMGPLFRLSGLPAVGERGGVVCRFVVYDHDRLGTTVAYRQYRISVEPKEYGNSPVDEYHNRCSRRAKPQH